MKHVKETKHICKHPLFLISALHKPHISVNNCQSTTVVSNVKLGFSSWPLCLACQNGWNGILNIPFIIGLINSHGAWENVQVHGRYHGIKENKDIYRPCSEGYVFTVVCHAVTIWRWVYGSWDGGCGSERGGVVRGRGLWVWGCGLRRLWSGGCYHPLVTHTLQSHPAPCSHPPPGHTHPQSHPRDHTHPSHTPLYHTPPSIPHTPIYTTPGNMVNTRAVCILLECILVCDTAIDLQTSVLLWACGFFKVFCGYMVILTEVQKKIYRQRSKVCG